MREELQTVCLARGRLNSEAEHPMSQPEAIPECRARSKPQEQKTARTVPKINKTKLDEKLDLSKIEVLSKQIQLNKRYKEIQCQCKGMLILKGNKIQSG